MISSDSGRKVAILLGDFGVDTLVRAKALAEAVLMAKPSGFEGDVEVCFGLPEIAGNLWQENCIWLSDGLPSVVVRRLAWQRVLAPNVRRMFAPLNLPVSMRGLDRVTLPRDWGTNFLDCSCWFVVAGTEVGGVYPARPTAVFCADLAQRRNPYAFAASMGAPFWTEQIAAFKMWRQSAAVVASDPLTALDLVDYAGVGPDRVVELRHALDVPNSSRPSNLARRQGEILIHVEHDCLHELQNPLEAFEQYRAEGGALKPTLISTILPEGFGPKSNLPEIVSLSAAVRTMLEEMPIVRLRSHRHGFRWMERFEWVWSIGRCGGDGRRIREALRSGAKVLCPDTPLAAHAYFQAGGLMRRYKESSVDELVEVFWALESHAGNLLERRPLNTVNGKGLAREIGFLLDRLWGPAHV